MWCREHQYSAGALQLTSNKLHTALAHTRTHITIYRNVFHTLVTENVCFMLVQSQNSTTSHIHRFSTSCCFLSTITVPDTHSTIYLLIALHKSIRYIVQDDITKLFIYHSSQLNLCSQTAPANLLSN